ncbi:Asp23/Gls24 family envelope stress response protein [Streptantibioticus ferralitis]|uniref:Asp23/Gls24 family envelope stress response protein n=1 Tax=Streptantibioticus ferralitis TaxID=236510 RepID=A0ABT5YZ64_9ACTN|nr:Asp23/Gls24 family envelope stress response protein [Streptantibioticus ferralitis]MDF2256886.1 Asp23/Gls24 family envelope stress response protein [Streptantibioticus ferralitis]
MRADPPAVLVPAAERGRLRIADRVVAKIAAQAAREALGEAPQAHRVPGDRVPHVSVSVRPAAVRESGRRLATVRLSVELGYPVDVRSVCAAVRRRVVEKVGALTDMDVPEVSVAVERLHSAAMGRAEQGRTT